MLDLSMGDELVKVWRKDAYGSAGLIIGPMPEADAARLKASASPQ